MIAPDLETAADFLRRLVDASRVVLPFTGAGISTECGIPDFRSPGGIWTKLQPIPFDAFRSNREMRDESWRRRFAMAHARRDAQKQTHTVGTGIGGRDIGHVVSIEVPDGHSVRKRTGGIVRDAQKRPVTGPQ